MKLKQIVCDGTVLNLTKEKKSVEFGEVFEANDECGTEILNATYKNKPVILTNIAIISGTISFYITKGDMIQQNMNSMVTHFSTYPEGKFNTTVKTIFYTLLPIGYIVFLPIKVISEFNIIYTLIVISITILTTILAFLFFNKGLKRYSSSNLMSARI